MSRYEVDKVFHEIVINDEPLNRFLADPVTFLEGRALNEEERRALIERDFGALYAMGGHPFMLWNWATRVSAERGLELVEKYTAAIEPFGFPDIAT